MAYNANAPADNQYIAQGPADIRNNAEALRTGAIVNAGTLNGLTNSNATGQIPMSNGTVNTNLNADLLDGQHGTYYAPATHTHSAVTTSSNGFMINTDKSKMDGIAAGAEVNQMAFSNIQVGSTTIQADSKTDTLTLTAGYGTTLTPDATNDAVTIAIANDGTNASHSHVAATTGAAGFISAVDKGKLDGIAAGAEVNQMAFSTIVAGGVSAVADSKTDTFTINAGAGMTITGDATNDACTIAITPNGHSHNDATQSADGFMSTTDKIKLDGIAAGAQINQNAFSNVLVGGTTVAADSVTDTLELVAGTNIALTPDATNDRVTIAVSGKVASAGTADTAGTCTGNAATATKLATARTITTSGDATGSATSFDGSANITIPLTLAASGVTAGTYDSVTVDVKGRVTAGTNPSTISASTTGNAATATKLQTARTINDVLFDGSANIAITQVNGKPIATTDQIPIITHGQQLYTTAGTYTFTVPAGSLFVTLVGGGGGAAGGSDTGAGMSHPTTGADMFGNYPAGTGSSRSRYGGDGGLGGRIVKYPIAGLTVGNTVTVTVGAGGAGGFGDNHNGSGTSKNGSAGGASSFGSYISVSGGGGGLQQYYNGGAYGTDGISYVPTYYGTSLSSYGMYGVSQYQASGTAGGSGMVLIEW